MNQQPPANQQPPVQQPAQQNPQGQPQAMDAQTLLQSLVNSFQAIAQGGAQGGAQAAGPVPFALTPGQADADDVIDFRTSVGMKRYEKAVKPLAKLFDHQLGRTVNFSTDVKAHATAMGWDRGQGNIISIPDSKTPPVLRNLIDEYGMLTLEEIKAHVETYRNLNNRQAQNAAHMCTFLLDSLDTHTREAMTSSSKEWSIDGKGYGPLLYKVIINKTIVDNHHTTTYLEDRLEGLPNFMVEVDSNIDKFHQEYREVTSLLEGRGKTDVDGLKYLWRSYALCKDPKFRAYMERKKEEYDDSYPNTTLTPDRLILMAQNKYTLRTRAGANVWGSKSNEEERIVALAAEVEALKAEALKGDLKLADNIAQTYGRNSSNTITKNKPQKLRGDPAFEKLKRTPPKEGEPVQKYFGPQDHRLFKAKKLYHWCPYHMLWTLHTPGNCEKGKMMDKLRQQKKKQGGDMQRYRAYQAFMSFLSDDDPENCFTSFDEPDEDAEAEAFEAEIDEEGYGTEGSNTL